MVTRSGVKPREKRLPASIDARMREGLQWSNIRIRNASSRGLMAECEKPPAPKTYVDIRRGTIVVVGRVVWRNGSRFGVRTQDRLDIQGLICEPRQPRLPPTARDALPERRATPRRVEAAPQWQERSRFIAAKLQYVAVIAIGAGVSIALAVAAGQILSRSLAAVRANLDM